MMERLTIDEVIEHCRRTCEKTELFAIARGQEQSDITSKNYWEHYQVEEWLRELKQYRDLEEQGLLIRTRCAVGDNAYHIIHDEVAVPPIYISEHEVKDVSANAVYFADDWWTFEELSECNVFLDKKEAERVLGEMNK